MATDSVPMKQCSRKERCVNPAGYWLPATAEYFRASTRKPDGLRSPCKICLQHDDAQWRAENREQVLESQRRYREANLEQLREANRRYRAENREQLRERVNLWQEANPDKVRELNRRYREANPDKV